MNLKIVSPSLVISQADIKTAIITSGEILRINIRSVEQDGTVKLLLKGIPVEAKTDIPLDAAGIISVKTAITDGKIILRLIPSDETNKILDMVNGLISEKADIGKLLNELKTMDLKPINNSESLPALKTLRDFLDKVLIDGSTVTKDAVKDMIEKGGQFYEAFIKKLVALGTPKTSNLVKLAQDDLKPIIMSLIKELAEDGRYKGVSKTAGSILKNIELSQLINRAESKTDTASHFQIPVYFGDNLETLELYFFEDKKPKTRGKQDYGIILSIELRGLGNITFDARVKMDTVFINIYVENKETSEFISRHSEILKNGMRSIGMHVSGIECMVSKKQITKKPSTIILHAGLIDEFA